MKKQIIDLSKEIIKINSTKDNPDELKKAIDWSKKTLKGFSFKEFNRKDSPSIIFYNTNKLPKKFKLILNAHLDIVPCKKEQLSSSIQGDKLVGRGSYDMKSAGVVSLLAFKKLSETIDYPIGLQFVTDEEMGGFDGVHYQLEEGIRSDFVISAEPTNYNIVVKAKGPIWIDITTKGSSAHAAYPWRGENAIVKLNKIIDQILKKWPTPKEEGWQTTCNVAWLKTSNKTANKVPDEASARLDIRCIPKDVGRVIPFIKKIIDDSTSLVTIEDEPAQSIKENNPYLQKLRKSAEKIINTSPKLSNHHGASDVRHFNKFGMVGVEIGPKGYGHHSEEEWVSIKSLENLYKIFLDFGQRINT
ncbi:M20 family metallopeptidase [Patescibacteria group bacterium]